MKGVFPVPVASLVLAGLLGAQETPDKPLAEQGYLGLAVRDIPSGHTVVSWLFPGPLHGEGLAAPTVDLSRPDLLVSVDGKAMTKDEFEEYIPSLAPGTDVTLAVRTSNRRGGTIPDELDHVEEVRTLTVTLESREEWAGTIHRGRAHEGKVYFDGPPMLDFRDPENVLGAAVAEHRLVEPLETLTAVFTDYLAENDDFHSLSRVRAPFESPFRMPELASWVTSRTLEAPANPYACALGLCEENLDLPQPKPRSGGADDLDLREIDVPESARQVVQTLQFTRWHTDRYASMLPPRNTVESALSFLRVPRRTFYLAGDGTKNHVEVIRRSMDVQWEDLEARFGGWGMALDGDLARSLAAFDDPLEPLPDDHPLGGAVEGRVLALFEVEGTGWAVIGGDGPNRYDTAKIAIILDRGGNDEYWASGLRLGTHLVLDLAGDDVYTGTPDQGPGSALLGISIIDDHAGDDRYEGELLSCGAAMFGMSLLLDRGGNDVYRGTEWSMGAACYGAGLLFDLGKGNDQYLGDFLCEGVGGPRGFGCIVDENGRDLYRANGPTPSAYGTPAVYQSFSQGMGFGYRQYAAGGIGMISDLGGDDRYEAGEFAQGGAYYFGLGILHDAAGNDLYYGNRYGQGFGVHQAAGILADDAGDDTYWSMTAASQGAGWDVGVGMLIDRAGNDSYQCDGLGQGGASMQAIGMLLDLGGIDRYVARGGGIQGLSGGNSYHWHDTGAFSFSLLLDEGGEPDHYSSGRSNDAVTASGARNDSDPKNSTLHGLVIDR